MADTRIINPRVRLIDYGPKIPILNRDGKVERYMGPDEITYAAAGITYKDTGFFQETLELEKAGEMDRKKIITSLIKSAGAGHASMATTPVLWFALEGDSSKLVDALFTESTFSSSLMPSSRRVPIAVDQIVVPKGIASQGNEAISLYTGIVRKSIELYERMQVAGVPKEEAAKIVPYGHRGGGFLQMPLETFISLEREFESSGNAVPEEGREIIRQMKEYVKNSGMGITYEARKASPRTGCPDRGIFHTRTNSVTDLLDTHLSLVLRNPLILSSQYREDKTGNREKRIGKYLERRKDIFSHPERIEKEWPSLLREMGEIVQDYNGDVEVEMFANSPLRVWGEVKRHRTLNQATENIYHAVGRAIVAMSKTRNVDAIQNESAFQHISSVLSIPPKVKENPELLREWVGMFSEAVEAYKSLWMHDVESSDAIALIPRGIKVGIIKKKNLYDLTTGYDSLRLCKTCEPEMRRTTQQESDLVIKSDIPEDLKLLMDVKCCHTGFCPDKNCGIVQKFVPGYTPELHEALKKAREAEIRAAIDS